MMELAKSFEPGNIENRWYDRWEAAGYFKPSMDTDRPSFCIQLPPPNVTGTLHMGHAFNQTIMDGLTRYYRMTGDNTLWVPGADHAGIATQIVVERQLAEQGVSRHDLGRDAFIGKVWEWKEKSGGTITSQMRRVGCSVDWDKEYFTMDDKMSTAVTEVFVRVDTFGTGVVDDATIERAVERVFDFRPAAIIETLGLRKPIYRQTAAYGHFGRLDLDLPWERLDRVEALKAAIGK